MGAFRGSQVRFSTGVLFIHNNVVQKNLLLAFPNLQNTQETSETLYMTFFLTDPFDWTSENIFAWASWAGRKLLTTPTAVDPASLPRTGRALCALTLADFCALAGGSAAAGATLHTHLAILRGQTVEPRRYSTPPEGRSASATPLERHLVTATPPWGRPTATPSPSLCDSSLSEAAASPASIPASPLCKY